MARCAAGPVRSPWFLALLLSAGGVAGATVPSAAQAATQPIRLSYEVRALGFTVLELDAAVHLAPEGYRMEMHARTRGLAASLVPGEQVTLAEGRWQGVDPVPVDFRFEGVWRGRPRHLVLNWPRGEPVVQAMEPPNDAEREPVPAELRRGTVDALSAFAKLARTVAETGRCDGEAAVFDGRRRFDFAARTLLARDHVPNWGAAWAGAALRCSIEGQQLAGFRLDQDRAEAAEAQRVTTWFARVLPEAPPVPVRAEMPSRWFGTVVAYLVRVEPGTAQSGATDGGRSAARIRPQVAQ